jgi:hypothetical protein
MFFVNRSDDHITTSPTPLLQLFPLPLAQLDTSRCPWRVSCALPRSTHVKRFLLDLGCLRQSTFHHCSSCGSRSSSSDSVLGNSPCDCSRRVRPMILSKKLAVSGSLPAYAICVPNPPCMLCA